MSVLFISGIVLAVFIVVTTCFGVVNNRTDGKFKVAEIGFMAFAIPSVFLGVFTYGLWLSLHIEYLQSV